MINKQAPAPNARGLARNGSRRPRRESKEYTLPTAVPIVSLRSRSESIYRRQTCKSSSRRAPHLPVIDKGNRHCGSWRASCALFCFFPIDAYNLHRYRPCSFASTRQASNIAWQLLPSRSQMDRDIFAKARETLITTNAMKNIALILRPLHSSVSV